MKILARQIGLLTLFFLTTISCAKQQTSPAPLDPQGLHDGALQLLRTQSLSVIDEHGLPISGASILIGFEPGVPFSGNVLTTNSMGLSNAPAHWQMALPVTIQAAGYITSTIPSINPGELTLTLAKLDENNEFEVRGTATEFGRLVQDGKVDFALIIPALKRENLLAFDLSTVISPKIDTIEILGNEVPLPSNISLPRQTENYSIFQPELNKPEFRVYLRHPGEQTVSATHGQFPFQRVVNDIRAGKSIFELINHFTFLEGGQKAIDVQGNLTNQNIAVSQKRFDTQISVRAPSFPAGQQLVNLALVEQNGSFIPTDLKRINANQTLNMRSFNGAGLPAMFSFLVEATRNAIAASTQPFSWFRPFILNSDNELPIVNIYPNNDNGNANNSNANNGNAATQDFTRLSFSFVPASGGVAPQFLPLIQKPTLAGSSMTLDAPALSVGLVPVATYLVLSEIGTIKTGEVVSERHSRLWEIWSNIWLTQVELPKILFSKRPDRTYRWEVMFMARPANFIDAIVPASRVDLTTITHVTRNALDI